MSFPIPCRICGEPTLMNATALCDPCYELVRRAGEDIAHRVRGPRRPLSDAAYAVLAVLTFAAVWGLFYLAYVTTP